MNKIIGKLSGQKTKENIFYFLLIICPLIQFVIMYVVVNVNSFVMPFRKYTVSATESSWSWVGFENFKFVLTDSAELRYGLINSLKLFAVCFVVGISLSLLLSFYVYKKRFASGFFQVVLFLPSIISPIILAVIVRYYADKFLPTILNSAFGTKIPGLLSVNEQNTIFPTMVIFTVFCGFGINVLLYVGAMHGISESVIEACQLDGASYSREFFSIVLPQILPTILVFVTTSIAGLFTNQMNLFSVFGTNLKDNGCYTIGYYIYLNVLVGGTATYPIISALGVLTTLVVAPIVIVVRILFRKLDPMED